MRLLCHFITTVLLCLNAIKFTELDFGVRERQKHVDLQFLSDCLTNYIFAVEKIIFLTDHESEGRQIIQFEHIKVSKIIKPHPITDVPIL